MGLSTNLFVGTKEENILKIMPKVINVLNDFIRTELDQYANRKGFDNRSMFLFRDKDSDINKDLKDFSNGIISCETHDFESFSIFFTIKGEKRRLFVTHSCSNDYSEIYKGEKIIFTLGCWGMSEKIMMVISEVVKEFRDVYYDYNDCDEIEPKKIN